MDRPARPVAQPGEWALQDLHTVVAGGLAVAGPLLSAGEQAFAQRLLQLSGAPGRLYARLAARVGEVFRLHSLKAQGYEDVESSVEALRALDLVHGGLPDSVRLPCYTVEELKAVCRRLGLPARGARPELEQRLIGLRGWAEDPAVRVVGKSLLRRLERLWFRSPWQDRTLLVRERLGILRWPQFDPGPLAPPLRSRAELLRLEQLWAGGRPETPELCLLQLRLEPVAAEPGGSFDARRILLGEAMEQLRALERAGEAGRAAALYAELMEIVPAGAVAQRWALALEADGRRGEAFEVCVAAMERSEPADRLALARTGRRLGRALGRSWRAEPPLRAAAERELPLPAVDGEDRRLRWGEERATIEQACVQQLAPREAIWGENTVWTTLFGLLFADLYWLPVPGMLPTRFLSGPLDLGSPGFALRRQVEVQRRLDQLSSGEGPRLIAQSVSAYESTQLAGVAWGLATPTQLLAIAEGLGPASLRAAMQILLDEGFSAARGLPDLVVLPGAPTVLPQALPSVVPQGLLLAEVKGPSDSLRDEQRIWHDRLLRAGVQVEIWRVKEQR